MRHTLLVLAVLAAFLVSAWSCVAEPTPEQQRELDRIAVAQQQLDDRVTEVVERVEDAAPQLADDFRHIVEGTATPEDVAEFYAALSAHPDSLRSAVQESLASAQEWVALEERKARILEDAGGLPWWGHALYTAGGLLVGSAVPTSGPRFLRRLLAGLAPALEAVGARDPDERIRYHAKRYGSQPPPDRPA